MKRITEYDAITTVAENDVVPVVDVSDTTQASSGSTKKGTIAKIADYLKDRAETLTGKTLTSPKINEDVAVTATSTELNQLDGAEVGGNTSGDIVTTDDTQTLTGKTFTSPKLNEDVALTATSTELNLLDNQTVLRKQTLYGSSIGVVMGAGATQYVGTYKQNSSAYLPAIQVASAGTISDLRVYASAVPGTDKTYTCTIMVTNVASGVEAIMASGSNSAADTSNSVSVGAGAFICLRVVTTAGANENSLQWSVLFEAD